MMSKPSFAFDHSGTLRKGCAAALATVVVGAIVAPMVTSMSGCDAAPSAAPNPQDQAPMNRAMLQWLNNAAVDNAIIAQATLQPYHFVSGAAELNDLGRRDLMVLANHHRMHPGTINVRRGKTHDALYDARVDTVRSFCVAAGVASDRLAIEDGFLGGDGIPADRVIRIQLAPTALTATATSS